METNKASRVTLKHIVCCALLLIAFVLTIGIHINADGATLTEEVAETSDDVIPLQISTNLLVASELGNQQQNEVELAGPKEEVEVEEDLIENVNYLNEYITKYEDELEFFAKTFSVSYEDILEDLNKIHLSNEEFDETNIGLLEDSEGNVKTFDTVEYGIVEYFYNYVKNNPTKINTTRVPYTGAASYVENLIIYYTTHIYTNVNPSVALSIGAAESGYYKVTSMLTANNVYGGMSSNGLIKYRNIEYGVLSYIRMLSKGYYAKGLTTISAIGKVYCPTYDDNGNKIASPHWISLVNTAMSKYKNYDLNISISDLLEDE